MHKEMLEEYKKLPELVKLNISEFPAFNACYERDGKLSDDKVLFITNIAFNCWLKDEYSKAGIVDYVNYILDGIYEYGASKEELESLSYRDIVSSFINEDKFEKLLQFDDTNYEYCFTINNGNKFYCEKGDDNFCIVNSENRIIQKTNSMDSSYEIIFDLLKEDKIIDMSFQMHYNIRCIVKDSILPDEEFSVEYKEGINNYIKYCKDRFITSEDILKAVKLNNDISLTDIDGLYIPLKKMDRLARNFYNLSIDEEKFNYVASFDNGVDYYYRKGVYLALDSNNVVKEFFENKNFILKELTENNKIAYLTDTEIEKIKNEIEYDYNNLNDESKDNIFNIKKSFRLEKFMDYMNNKKIDNLFSSRSIYSTIELYKSMAKSYQELVKNNKNKEKNKDSKKIDTDLELN